MVLVLVSLNQTITGLWADSGIGISMVYIDLLDKGALVTHWVAQGRRQLNFILWIAPFILFAYQFTEWFTIYRPLPYIYQSGTGYYRTHNQEPLLQR